MSTQEVAPIRLIQVGLGGWGRNWHTTRLAPSPLVKVVAIVDESRGALEAAAGAIGFSADRAYESLDEALSAHEADAVLVTASLPGHVPAARTALAAEKHVLLEKPFAPSVAQAHELVDLAATKKRLLMISQNYRYFPAPIRAAQAVASGELGRLGVVHVDFRRPSGPYNEARRKHYELPHPLLADMAIHHFDLMRMITGSDAKRIRCFTYNPPWTHFTDRSSGEAVVEMENGVVVTYRGSWESPGPQTPWSGEWRLEFERGEILFSSRDDETGKLDRLTIRTADGKTRRERLPRIAAADRSGSLAEFVSAIRSGRTQGPDAPANSGAGNVGSIALTYASIEAAASGAWTAVER